MSKRFVKRQQMQWVPKGAHLLLQTRTKVFDGDLENVFRSCYPHRTLRTRAFVTWRNVTELPLAAYPK